MNILRRKISSPKAFSLLTKVILSYTLAANMQVGLPIGNLTSQILANMYLNEFDRYVRHVLKPPAYIRYGDDFILFCSDKQTALRLQKCTTVWLNDMLLLTVHPANNIVTRVGRGLHFLGHWIFSNGEVSVDDAMLRKLRRNNSRISIGSYKAMRVTEKQQKLLTWLLVGD